MRFEVALRTLEPGFEILAPVRDSLVSRAAQVAFLHERGLPVPAHGAAYSVNRGLWGTTIGGSETKTSQLRLLDYVAGGGESLDPVALIERVESTAAPFGIGRGIHLGETILGIKGRVAFEAPAAEVLLSAHRELEKLVLTGRQLRVKEGIAAQYGDLVHEGQHLEPVCRDLEAFLLSSQTRVTGEVHLLLRPGALFVEGVESPFSLLAASRGAYGEAAGEWTAADARGFARLAALPGELHARAGTAPQAHPKEQEIAATQGGPV